MMESRLYDEAVRLRACVERALRRAPIAAGHRSALRDQAAEVPHNIALTLARLHRLREVKQDLYATPLPNAYVEQKRELVTIERELLVELRSSLEVLSSVPISLMRVEMTLRRSEGAAGGRRDSRLQHPDAGSGPSVSGAALGVIRTGPAARPACGICPQAGPQEPRAGLNARQCKELASSSGWFSAPLSQPSSRSLLPVWPSADSPAGRRDRGR